MASPNTAITRVELGVMFDEFGLEASRAGFIGPGVLRPCLVGEKSADVPRVSIGHKLAATRDIARAPKAGYNRDFWEWGKFSFNCVERGVEEVLDDATIAAYRALVDAEAVSRSRAIDRVLRPYEIEVAGKVFDDVTWGAAGDLGTEVDAVWDDEGAVPLSDVAAARRAVWLRTGLWPNAVVMSAATFESLKTCDQVLDRIVSGGSTRDPAQVTRAAVAALFEVDAVLVGDGAYNTSLNPEEPSFSTIWPDGMCMVARVATTSDLSEVCLGRTFLWPGDGAAGFDDSELAVLVEEYREEGRRGSVLRARTYWDTQILYPECGQMLHGLLTEE